MHVAILGFGREGKSVLKFIKKSPEYHGAEIDILDKKIGKNYLKNLKRFDLIFRSPGIPYNLPELKRARKNGVKFSSATKLFFEKINRQFPNYSPAPRHRRADKFQIPTIIGITGTKGKGTTATLLYKILKAAHKKVFLAGNIGTSALDILPRLSAPGTRGSAFVILELSSFQLQDLEWPPQIAVVLDVFPDHLDAHLNIREYYGAKTNIARHQKPDDKTFFFKNQPLSRWVASKSRGKKIGVEPEKFNLFRPADLKIKGWHNFKNAVMAATVARALGVPDKIIIKTVKKFRGTEHRLELVRVMRAPRGLMRKNPRTNAEKSKSSARSALNQGNSAKIEFYNDSASTNPQTMAAAARAFAAWDMPSSQTQAEGRHATKKIKPLSHVAFSMPLILIAGGQDKGLDYKPLARALKNSGTKLVVLFGQNKKKIARAIQQQATRSKKQGAGGKRPGTGNKRQKIKFVSNLQGAVAYAYKFAMSLATSHQSSVIVLFSPGAASFDMFKNYADRGAQFKKIVKLLT